MVLTNILIQSILMQNRNPRPLGLSSCGDAQAGVVRDNWLWLKKVGVLEYWSIGVLEYWSVGN